MIREDYRNYFKLMRDDVCRKEHCFDVIKRKFRREMKTEEPDRKYFHREGSDGYYEYFAFPDNVDTVEKANEFFDAYCRIPYVDRGYDCTGQWFTCYHKIFHVGDDLCCLHYIAMDV